MNFPRFKTGFRTAIIACLLTSCGPDDTRLKPHEVTAENDRKQLMREARQALATLADMTGGQQRFRVDQARLARRNLISTTKNIPHVFRSGQPGESSHARPEIWANWDDFQGTAAKAEKAARRLKAGSSKGLRRTLPDMVHACLACHQVYRTPGRKNP